MQTVVPSWYLLSFIPTLGTRIANFFPAPLMPTPYAITATARPCHKRVLLTSLAAKLGSGARLEQSVGHADRNPESEAAGNLCAFQRVGHSAVCRQGFSEGGCRHRASTSEPRRQTHQESGTVRARRQLVDKRGRYHPHTGLPACSRLHDSCARIVSHRSAQAEIQRASVTCARARDCSPPRRTSLSTAECPAMPSP